MEEAEKAKQLKELKKKEKKEKKEQKEAAEKEQREQREAALKEQREKKEAALKEAAQKEAARREAAQKEAAQKEAARKEAAQAQKEAALAQKEASREASLKEQPETKRRGSFADRWRSRKGSDVDTLPPKSPSPLSSPPISPTLVAQDDDAVMMPAIDITENPPAPASAPTSPMLDEDFAVVPATPEKVVEEDGEDLPMMLDESLIFTEKLMHQVSPVSPLSQLFPLLAHSKYL